MVEGGAGIGKTALVTATMSWARAHGVRVLRGRGGTFETAFGYGVVRQLFERVLQEAPRPLSLRRAGGDRIRADPENSDSVAPVVALHLPAPPGHATSLGLHVTGRP